MKTQEIHELVERYVRGDLSKEQQEFVGDKIKSDEAFREAYALHKDIKRALLDDDMREYEQLLQDVYHEKNASGSSGKSRRVYYAVAAAIVVLIGLGTVLFFQMNRKAFNERLFEQYYTKYTFDNYRSEQQSDLIIGYAYYMEQQYDSAAMIARQFLKKQDSMQAGFLAGLSLLADGRCSESIRFFTRVAQSGNMTLKENAEWYKALALLKLNRMEEAALLLSRIKRAKNDYSDQAADLLKKIHQ